MYLGGRANQNSRVWQSDATILHLHGVNPYHVSLVKEIRDTASRSFSLTVTLARFLKTLAGCFTPRLAGPFEL